MTTYPAWLSRMSAWMYVSIFCDSGSRLSEATFSTVFFLTSITANRKYSDVMSSVVVDPNGVKVRVKFGDSRSNRSRNIRLPHFVTNDNDDAGRQTLSQFKSAQLLIMS